MSAQLNTLSGTIYEDFIVKMLRVKVSNLTASIIMKCTVVIVGSLCVVLVLVVERMKGILQVRKQQQQKKKQPLGLRLISFLMYNMYFSFHRWRSVWAT